MRRTRRAPYVQGAFGQQQDSLQHLRYEGGHQPMEVAGISDKAVASPILSDDLFWQPASPDETVLLGEIFARVLKCGGISALAFASPDSLLVRCDMKRSSVGMMLRAAAAHLPQEEIMEWLS